MNYSNTAINKCLSKMCLCLCLFLATMAHSPLSLSNTAYDFDNGNASLEVVINAIPPEAISHVSPTLRDGSLVFRFTTLLTNAWYEASAPYHPTAVGVYSRLGRRPASESETNRNINVALIYASYQILNDMLPEWQDSWDAMLTDVGLNPNDTSTDLTTAVGIGNAAGIAVIEGRANDGMNQKGNAGNKVYNNQPYSDYTGYIPLNTANYFFAPSRWQPDVEKTSLGIFVEQHMITPQYAFVEPYSFRNPKKFRFPKPWKSDYLRYPGSYEAQADEVIAISANLTDEQKLKAELFDNKLDSLASSIVFLGYAHNMPLLDYLQLEFVTNIASFDNGIVAWQEKTRYDSVRPFSAIRWLKEGKILTSWGGPGKGTVDDMPGEEWLSYMQAADHPEYPSGSTCNCYAHSQAARRFLGSDDLGFFIEYPQGSSKIEPGVTPAYDMTLSWATWSDFEEDCGLSRMWGGVHFRSAVEASAQYCGQFGDLAMDYMTTLIEGTAKLREPSKSRYQKKRNKWHGFAQEILPGQ